MGKFKEYLVNEVSNIKNLDKTLDQLIQKPHLGHQISKIYNSDIDFPSRIPNIVRTGQIIDLKEKKSPIYIRLSDGTEAHFTFDEFKRIKGKPAIGKNMTIVFQRHPKNQTDIVSKIEKATVN